MGAQDDIKLHFEQLYRRGITPWKDHPPEPPVTYFFHYLKERKPDAKLLDIGCGDGWISLQAARNSFEIWGIDSSETAIAEAKEDAAIDELTDQVHFQVGDALDLPYRSASFDAAFDRGLFHHILPENRERYFNTLLRVLKEKSWMYIAVFSEKNPEGVGQRFARNAMADLFGRYFIPVRYTEDPYPSAAPAHLMHFILERRRGG